MKVKNANIFRGSMLGVAAAGCMVAMPAAAEDIEVSASAAVASLYLFRGADLGNGNAVVSGDIIASMAGFYGGIWGSSGDSSSGSEYDIFAGYSMEFDGVSVDAGLINYIYPQNDANDTFGRFSEFYLGVGFMGFGFDYSDNIAGDSGFEYYAFSYALDKFTILMGMVDVEEPESTASFSNDSSSSSFGGSILVDYTHLDLSYAYNDNLSFTLSKVVAQDEIKVGAVTYEKNQEDDLLFVVSYSLPLDIK